ncbi:hypothetical protein [Methanobacterium sp.]|uniref:hypothetical protein n=1 Tax=Methanobacterium sp. TaxID=2164 RepID=UPI0025F2AE04|nr:hypothetical protein [Methanobacterium sp.]MBI5459212.1 hypothetical protein [Methanobacterium sp.]
MTNLSHLMGSLITQIEKGRVQGDLGVLEIAKLYKNDSILAGFPVPRMVLDSVEVDLKIAIDSVPISSTCLTAESQSQLMKQLKTMIHTLNIEKTFEQLIQINSNFQKVWQKEETKILEELSNLFTNETEIKPELHVNLATSTIMNHILSTIMSSISDLDTKNLQKFFDKDLYQLENRVKTQIEKIINNLIHNPIDDTYDIEVLVTSSELEDISPDKITTIKLKLKESDRSWIKTKEKEKLIPY